MKNVYPLIIAMVMAATSLSTAVTAEKIAPEPVASESAAPESMPLLERQRWAVAMLERLDEANRIILDPEYVARQRERFEEMATPFVIGTSKEQARQTVQALRDEVEKSERIAVEHLDRQFRQTLAQQLGSKSELKLRGLWFQGWQKTVQSWQKSDEKNDRLYLVLDWLQESCDTLEKKQYATVTPIPSFKAVIPPSESAVAEAETPVKPSAAVEPVKPVEPAEPTTRVAAKPKEPVAKDITPPEQVVEKPTPLKPEVVEPEVKKPGAPKPKVVEPQKPTTSFVPPSQRMTPPEIPPGLSVDLAEDRPVPPRRIVQKPITPPETLPKTKPEPQQPPLNINLSELGAQISGNNLALRRLEAKLVESGRWDAKRIDPFVAQLKKIAIHLEDARLFYGLLSPSQQNQVDKVGDSTAAIKTLRAKIRTARVATLEKRGPSANLTKEQRAELKHLDRLSDELNSIDDTKAVD